MARHYALLTGTPGGGEDAEAGAVALRNWLERSPYRWILVFDNAEPRTLDGILPRDGTGQVIITSRASYWPDADATLTLGSLLPDEALILLTRIAGQPADDDALQITAETDGLALAIEQAGAYIRQTHDTYRAYLAALRSDPRVLLDADLASAESVAARVWRRSLRRVTSGQDDHPAAAVLGVLSYLAPDDIPRQLLAAEPVNSVPLLAGLGPVPITRALGDLAAYSLISLDAESISIHRVIQHLTRLDAEDHGTATSYCAAAIGLLDACT